MPNPTFLILPVAMLLLSYGCASSPMPGKADERDSAAVPQPPAPTLTFEVDGPGTSPGRCVLNYYLMHPADMVPQELTTRIELYRRHDDLFVSELSGLTIELPDAEATETVFGMNSLLFTDRLTMGCEEVRAELTIEQCQPGPCPVIDTQPARNLIPVRILSP